MAQERGIEIRGRGKLEADIEVKTSADNFFKLLRSQLHEVPNASEVIHGVDVHKGDWESHGSIKQWTYTIEGQQEIFKEKVEIDEANKSMTMVAVDGHVLEQYKSYKIKYQCVPKEEEGALVVLTVEYELLKPDDPPPLKYCNFLVNALKDIDAHLVKA